jgi:hypothetical protein
MFWALVNDVNFSLFADSNSDARPGSIVEETRKFVLGSRVQAPPLDKRCYSRATTFTRHIVGVTCGSDAEVTLTSPPRIPTAASPIRSRVSIEHIRAIHYPSILWATRGKGGGSFDRRK